MKKTILTLSSLAVAGVASADQPIMNMMPRWDGGWGVQLIQEYRHESALKLGNQEIGNGLTENVHIAHLEGVYTWDRSIRLTVKVPYVLEANRSILDDMSNVVRQKDSGLGDITVALPLKKYFNLDGRSGSWTLAPQLRIPTNSKDEFDIYDRAWGAGLYAGYETETSVWFISVGAGAWFFEGSEEEEISAHIDLGWNFEIGEQNGQLLWETDFKYESDGTHVLKAGPAFYWRFNDTMHMRVEWKHDFIDYQGTTDHGNGNTFKVGLGFVF